MSPAPMHPGDQLDGYTLLRRIGAGGYGEVWLCRSDALADFHALKFIPAARPDRLGKEFKALARYRKAAAKLRSPHLMPIEHVGRSAEGLYYVMPLADGMDSGRDPADPAWSPLTLASLLQERSTAPTWFSCQEIAQWMCPLLSALQTLADAGLVHRDVKPDNILLCGGTPTLADIGLLDEDKARITCGGTPAYLTPSWYTGGYPDMYGAAATLYTLLTGNLPDRMGRSTFSGPPQGEQSLPPGELARRKHFHAVIRRATDELPAERYPDFLAMAAALTADLPPTAARKPFPRRRTLVPGAILLVAAGLIGWTTWTGPHPEPRLGLVPGRAGVLIQKPGRARADQPGGEVPKILPQPVENSLGMKFLPVPGTDVWFCVHETRWKDYAAYAGANPGRPAQWQNQTFDGFPVTDRPQEHPVVNVSWQDAVDFCRWLSEKEQRSYRLPTDREWSLAVGLEETWEPGDTPETVRKDLKRFPWGSSWPPPPCFGNYSDESRKAKARFPRPNAGYLEGYDDGFPTTAPVMSFAPNQFGLHDLGGNVMEWVQDSWNAGGTERVLRDRAWHQVLNSTLSSSARLHIRSEHRESFFGFRIVLEPDPVR